jgi:hypothetical protein
MNKPSDSHKETKDKHNAGQTGPLASQAAASGAKAWPFAPGSQLGKQVARPWTPKPTYRFNQR